MEASNNYSFYDLLIENGFRAGSDVAISTLKVKTGLPPAPTSVFRFSPEQRSMLDKIDASGVEVVLRSIVTTGGVKEFGELVNLACGERKTLVALHKIMTWSGLNASAAHASVPYSNPAISGRSSMPFAVSLHAQQRNVDLRGASGVVENGWVKHGEHYTMFCYHNKRDVVLCGLVPLDKTRSAPRCVVLEAPIIKQMGLYHYLRNGLSSYWAKHKYHLYRGGPVNALIVLPGGELYAQEGREYSEENVWAALSDRNVALSLYCPGPVFKKVYHNEIFYHYALKYGSYRPPYTTSFDHPEILNFTGPEQILNRCYKPMLQELVSRGNDVYQSLIDTLCVDSQKTLAVMNQRLIAWEHAQTTAPSTVPLKTRKEMDVPLLMATCNKPVERFEVDNFYAREMPPVQYDQGYQSVGPQQTTTTTISASSSAPVACPPPAQYVPPVVYSTNVFLPNRPPVVHPMVEERPRFRSAPGLVVISSDDAEDDDDDRFDEKEMEELRSRSLKKRLADAEPEEGELVIDEDEDDDDLEVDDDEVAFIDLTRDVRDGVSCHMKNQDVDWEKKAFEIFFGGCKLAKELNAIHVRDEVPPTHNSQVGASLCDVPATLGCVNMVPKVIKEKKLGVTFTLKGSQSMRNATARDLYMPTPKKELAVANVFAAFNSVFKVPGHVGGGRYAKSQSETFKAYEEMGPHIAVLPPEVCVLYGPFTPLPSGWGRDKKAKKYVRFNFGLDGKERLMDQGVFFTKYRNMFIMAVAKGVDSSGKVHARAVAGSVSAVQIVSFSQAYNIICEKRNGTRALARVLEALQVLTRAK